MGFPDTFQIPVSDTRAYQLFADAAVVPMVESVAKLMAPLITVEKPVASAKLSPPPQNIMNSNRWTKEQLKLAFNLYCQLPFGKLHSRNAEIIELATLIGRTTSAVAMKLVNFASLDPAITSTGRSGLGNASALDREVWGEFHADWERLAVECALLIQQLRGGQAFPRDAPEADTEFDLDDYSGETRQVLTEQRIKQSFFRRAVLASYRGRCCMSGLSDARLLVASHIVPWGKDKANRLNPSNGLCLSALHDKAFDKGLITLTDDFRVVVSEELKSSEEAFIRTVILPLNDRLIDVPERFKPQADFIAWHRNTLFVDNKNKHKR
jgi:DNA (cytosine-5)-methyltransferase 1